MRDCFDCPGNLVSQFICAHLQILEGILKCWDSDFLVSNFSKLLDFKLADFLTSGNFVDWNKDGRLRAVGSVAPFDYGTCLQ